MIEGFRGGFNSELALFYFDNQRGKIPSSIVGPLRRKLSIIEAAETEASLRIPPGNRFEHLRGQLKDFVSIRVNDQWRLLFHWRNGIAYDIYLDKHTYRSTGQ